jgi:hypothetical protein
MLASTGSAGTLQVQENIFSKSDLPRTARRAQAAELVIEILNGKKTDGAIAVVNGRILPYRLPMGTYS